MSDVGHYVYITVIIDGHLQQQACGSMFMASVNRADRVRVTSVIPDTGPEFDAVGAYNRGTQHQVQLIASSDRRGAESRLLVHMEADIVAVRFGDVRLYEDEEDPKDKLARMTFTFERVPPIQVPA